MLYTLYIYIPIYHNNLLLLETSYMFLPLFNPFFPMYNQTDDKTKIYSAYKEDGFSVTLLKSKSPV